VKRLFLLVFALAALNGTASAQSYVVTGFGPFPGGTLSSATDLNSSGTVAGYSSFAPNSATRAGVLANGTLTNLGAPIGATASWAWGINDTGVIAGSAIVSGQGVAFVYQNGTYTTLPTLGGNSGGARDINNSGLVTGNAALPGNSTSHAFRYDPASGVMSDLGTLGGSNSTGYAINANGWVVGTSDRSLASFTTQAFLARPGRTMFGLSLGGDFSAGYGINSVGKVVGQSSLLNNNNARHAFLFTGEAVLDLGTLGGTQATAYAINDSDVVVGSSLTATNATFHAFIYQNGVMTNLNSLLAPNSGWVLNEALAINNTGQIVGYGTFAGEQRGFILSPTAIPEPSTYAALAGLGALGLVLYRRRHHRNAT
jgi:probable HAF family extracellular repeat protein